MDYYSLSKKGTRDNNEDSIRVFEKDGDYYFIVADGLGGHSMGEIASKIATDTTQVFIERDLPPNTFFEQYFTECGNRLIDEQDKYHNPSIIKTTVVMAIVAGTSVSIAHVGDSRCYYFRKNKMLFRTLDHSVPQMLAIAGDIPERKIRNHPDRNRLLKVMGERQLMQKNGSLYDVKEIDDFSDGDALLLCSDGFWELITEHEMEKALKHSHSSAAEWMSIMENIVIKHGRNRGMDNYSAICVIR